MTKKTPPVIKPGNPTNRPQPKPFNPQDYANKVAEKIFNLPKKDSEK